MSKYLEKIYQNPHNQVYAAHGCLNFDMNFIYIYRDDNDEIKEMQSFEFPLMEFVQYRGFIFVKDNKRIPTPPSSFLDIFKTNIKNLNTQFNDKTYEIVLKLSGFRNCSPKINSNVHFGFSHDRFMKLTGDDVQKMYKAFFKSQTLKNINEFYDFIKECCPYDVNYKTKITDADFKTELTEDDVKIEYDIRHPDEIGLIKKVEELFDDRDSTIILLNDFCNTLEKVEKLVAKRDDIIAYKSKNKLAIKYSDLMKLGLKWTIENFY